MAPIATDDLKDYYPEPFPKDVPTIDLAKISVQELLEGNDEAAQTLFRVCSNEGFFYLDLTTHPTGQKFLEDSQKLHNVAKDVFNNVPIKDKLAYTSPDPTKEHLHTGYKCQSFDDNGEPDKAEFLNVSTWSILNNDPNYHLPPWLNQYTDIYRTFMQNGNAIGQIILSALERELHLTPGELTNIHKPLDPSGEFLRLFRYPAPKNGKPHATAPTPSHTDATSMTILFNWQGGLQITRPKEPGIEMEDRDHEGEEWLYVKPEPGHVIVNLGDPMVVLTNNVLKSGRHQVVTPPGPQGKYHRYSVLTNLRPTNDTPMRALKSDVIPPQEDGEVLTALEWSLKKVKAILDRMAKK